LNIKVEEILNCCGVIADYFIKALYRNCILNLFANFTSENKRELLLWLSF